MQAWGLWCFIGPVFVTFLLIVETCSAAVSTHSQGLSTDLSAGLG